MPRIYLSQTENEVCFGKSCRETMQGGCCPTNYANEMSLWREATYLRQSKMANGETEGRTVIAEEIRES